MAENFDEFLGGSIKLPQDVQISKLVAARASEISAMGYSIQNPQHTKLLFQKLPVHMRRRVMSHNAKRMPRKLREAHTMQMEKSGLPPPSKRPSRKYRRRPRNLLLEYSRRKRSKVWLETHIWHAKRFHMCEKWGYKIANFSNDRGYRASYRAVSKHCMIQDISYYTCIELTGSGAALADKLKGHCRDQLSFGARMYLSGTREGSLTFWKRNGEPAGTVNFLWQPGDAERRKIWIWVHPALLEDILSELLQTFALHEIDKSANSEKIDLNRVFVNDSAEFRMELLNCFNRFRLRGPLTLAVLADTLKVPRVPQSAAIDLDALSSMSKLWYDEWHQDPTSITNFATQKTLFENIVGTLNSPGQLPRSCVLALTVMDPRFFLPQTKKHIFSNQVCRQNLCKLPESASASPLWASEVRENIKMNIKSFDEINKLRSGNLVPGVANDAEFDEQIIDKVPVILLQQPGTTCGEKSTGFSSGVDIILPAGWALPFWIAFIHRCARPAGLRECRSVLFENLMLNSPEVNHPDTPAYFREAEEVKRNLTKKYFEYPSNRRVNFAKLSISSPFCCEWKLLVQEWTTKDTVSVLKDRTLLQILRTRINSLTEKSRKKQAALLPSSDEGDAVNKSVLVSVKVTIVGKGRPKNFALICLPSPEDLEGKSEPEQKSKFDVFEKKRKLLRLKHQQCLKRAARLRAKAKKLNKQLPKSLLEVDKIKHSEMMKSLYLPDCQQVRYSCDREVMGYVVQGDFSFTESKGIGWGYIVLQALLNLLDRGIDRVLVRNTQSRQYRFAKIDVIDCL